MFPKDKYSNSKGNTILMVLSGAEMVSRHRKSKVLTIFPSISLTDCHNYKTATKVKIDLTGIANGPVDNIFRIARHQKIRENYSDVYLILTELLEFFFFTLEDGIISYSEEELEILQEHFNFVGSHPSNLPKSFLDDLKWEDKAMVGGP